MEPLTIHITDAKEERVSGTCPSDPFLFIFCSHLDLWDSFREQFTHRHFA